MTQDCSVGVSTAVCTESASGSEANFPGSSTVTYGEGEEEMGEVATIPVTITAGANKLGASADAAPTSDASSEENTSVAASTGGSADVPSATSTQTRAAGASSSSAAPAEHTGAAVQGVSSNLGLVGAAAGLFAGLLI